MGDTSGGGAPLSSDGWGNLETPGASMRGAPAGVGDLSACCRPICAAAAADGCCGSLICGASETTRRTQKLHMKKNSNNNRVTKTYGLP